MTNKPTPEARRQAIVKAAIVVLAQHRFDAATTDDIARAAGLSKGGLYWHFKSKDDILAAILMQLFDQSSACSKACSQPMERWRLGCASWLRKGSSLCCNWNSCSP